MGFDAMVQMVVGLPWGKILTWISVPGTIGAVYAWYKERSRRSDDLRERIRELVQASRSDLADAEIRWSKVSDRLSHPFVHIQDGPIMISQLRRIHKQFFEAPSEAADEIHSVLHEEGKISIKQLESTHRRIRKVHDDQVISLKRFNAQMDRFEKKLDNPWMPWTRQ